MATTYAPKTEAPVSPDLTAPHSIEAEQALLGAAISDSQYLAPLVGRIFPDDFFIYRNGIIWSALLELFAAGEAIDNLTLVHKLKDKDQLDLIAGDSGNGSAYITTLINSVPFDAGGTHTEEYAGIVQRASMRRRLLDLAGKVANAAMQGEADIDSILAGVTNDVDAVASRRVMTNLLTGRDVVGAAVERWSIRCNNPTEVPGLRTGIPELDRLIGGLMTGRPYVLYGPTGSGKSTLASFIAANLMLQERGLIVATERDPIEWIDHAVADLAGITHLKLMRGDMTPEQAALTEQIYDRFYRAGDRFIMFDRATPSPEEVEIAVAQAIRDFGIKWVLIDSIHNIKGRPGEGIYDKTSAAADMALRLSKLGIVVLVTSQTGRNAKLRTNKMPELGDAVGSGKVEDNAEIVIGIYRHDYYIAQGAATEASRHNKKGELIYPEGGTILTFLKNGPTGKRLHLRFENGEFKHAPPGYVEKPAPVHYTDRDTPEL